MRKKITALTICLTMAGLCLVGCGGSKYKDSAYLGTWKGSSAEASGVEIELGSLFEQIDLTLDQSGEATLVIDKEEHTGEWEETENGFSVDGELDFVVDGDAASLDYDGVTIVFAHEK